MNTLIRPRTPLGPAAFANTNTNTNSSNIPRLSTPGPQAVVGGRKKAFEGVIKAVTARKTAVSLKAARTGDQNKLESSTSTPVRSATLANRKLADGLTLLSSVPEQNEGGSPFQSTAVIENTVAAVKSQPLPRRKAPSCEDGTPQTIIYSTTPSLTSTSSTPSDSGSSSLLKVSFIPSSGLSEEEELQVVGYGSFFGEEQGDTETKTKTKEDAHLTYIRCCTAPISTPIFLSEPAKSELKIGHVEKLIEEETEQLPPIPKPPVRRKPVDTEVPSLIATSREALFSKLTATRPITTSLLAFTENTSPNERRRLHPERIWRTRNATPDPDILLKTSLQRRRLIRAGLLNLLPLPLPHPSPSSSSSPSSSIQPPSPPKYFLYPRAGDLRALRSDESTACAEDFYLGYVDLSFIRKTLFAFDMRMRTAKGGGGGDLWGDEMEEIYRWFGREGEWEVDWDTRWRVAAWLLHQSDEDEEDGDDDAGVEEERDV